jgi:hypothetical protein
VRLIGCAEGPISALRSVPRALRVLQVRLARRESRALIAGLDRSRSLRLSVPASHSDLLNNGPTG